MNKLDKEFFIETMANIMTIEDILMAGYNLTCEDVNKIKNVKRADIERQLKEQSFRI